MRIGKKTRRSGAEPTSGDVAARIRKEARIVGLRHIELPSLESVERRRVQLWTLTVVLLAALGTGILLAATTDGFRIGGVPPIVLRLGVLGLTVAYCAYALEQEMHLRRLTRLLLDERLVTVALTNRLHELAGMVEAGRAVNSVLQLDAVLDIIIRNAIELLSAGEGSVMLLEGDDLLTVAAVNNALAKGTRTTMGGGIAGRVAETREPLLINGRADRLGFAARRREPVESAMSVPLVHRRELVGVLNVSTSGNRIFTEYDLRALSVFAEQAATAIANAQMYEQRSEQVSQLQEIDRARSEFVASVGHDLRTPLTTILGATQTAQREGIDAASRMQLLAGIERQAIRLTDMVEALLDMAKLERRAATPSLSRVDVSALVLDVREHIRSAFGEVELDVEPGCVATTDEDALMRVIDNLLDNARKYGAAPVRLSVHKAGERVLLTVTDAGPGVGPDDRERIFRSFSRLDTARKGGGLGLGLAIVRRFAESWGGSAWVEDGPDGGARFVVAIPI